MVTVDPYFLGQLRQLIVYLVFIARNSIGISIAKVSELDLSLTTQFDYK